MVASAVAQIYTLTGDNLSASDGSDAANAMTKTQLYSVQSGLQSEAQINNIQEMTDLGEELTYDNWKAFTLKKFEACNPNVDVASMVGKHMTETGLDNANCGTMANLNAGVAKPDKHYHMITHEEVVLMQMAGGACYSG